MFVGVAPIFEQQIIPLAGYYRQPGKQLTGKSAATRKPPAQFIDKPANSVLQARAKCPAEQSGP